MTKIIAVANHKGGSGKTTTTYYLGLALAGKGYDVLLIDLDDQGTLTSRMNDGDPATYTIADVLDGRPLVDAILKDAEDVDFVCADHRLAWIAARLQASSPNHAFLRQAWQRAGLTASYDYVLLDCPPSAGVMLINALALADAVIIPATPTEESYAGLLRMNTMIEDVSGILNHQVQPLGVVLTMTSPASASEQHYIALLRDVALGSVPRRVGRDADDQLRTAYARIAGAIISKEESC